MITNLALQALELFDKGISVKVDNDQLVITREDGEKSESTVSTQRMKSTPLLQQVHYQLTYKLLC